MIYMHFYIHILYVGAFAYQWRFDGGQMFDHIVRNWARDNGSEKDVSQCSVSLTQADLSFFLFNMQISPTFPNIPQWPSSLWVQEMTWHAVYAGEEVSKSRKHLSHVL